MRSGTTSVNSFVPAFGREGTVCVFRATEFGVGASCFMHNWVLGEEGFVTLTFSVCLFVCFCCAFMLMVTVWLIEGKKANLIGHILL
jgi:hypothetical protein